VVKTTCVFAVKTGKNGSKHGARMVQPWYGLGAENVNRNPDDTIFLLPPFAFVKGETANSNLPVDSTEQ